MGPSHIRCALLRCAGTRRFLCFTRAAHVWGWLGNRMVSVLNWGAEGPGFKSQPRRCRVTVLDTTVHTHRACVHQTVKLVAALLRVARVTASLTESNGSLPSGLWLTSPAGWLPRTGISSRALRSVIKYGLPLFTYGWTPPSKYTEFTISGAATQCAAQERAACVNDVCETDGRWVRGSRARRSETSLLRAIRARTCPWTLYSAVTDTEVRRRCFRSKTGYERPPSSKNARIISPTGNYKFYYQLNIGVNATGVAGVATPNIWPAGVVVCWWPPDILTSVLFFPSAEPMNTTSRCHFHLRHITPFWDEKFINFLGRGTRCLDSRVFGARPATPNVPVALTPTQLKSMCWFLRTIKRKVNSRN